LPDGAHREAAKGKPNPSSGKSTYVAMGDSYASGNGTFNADLDGPCYRSSDAYAPLVAKQLRRTTLTFVACSGATTQDVVSEQLGALDAKTTYATVSVGGNDIGFTDLISACVSGGESVCAAAVATAESAIADELPGKLDTAYAAIGNEAPTATVVVVGYPRGFDPARVSCFQAYGISPTEAGLLNGVSDDLNAVIGDRADSAGFRYVDPSEAFAGHDVCASTPYLNGFLPVVTGDTRDAYHPTTAGHANGFEPLVYDALTTR
jgi:lysophospholipase L1-like esterase